MTRDYTRESLMTPERIRYNEAARTLRKRKAHYKETQTAHKEAMQDLNAAIAEMRSAYRALQESLPHGTHTN